VAKRLWDEGWGYLRWGGRRMEEGAV
jgi:hypothetical protein